MVSELRGKALIAVILAASGLDFLLFGYDQGLFGGILGGSRFKAMLGEPGPTMTGLVTGMYDIGCAIGAVAAFVWGENLGRKKSIILANVIVIVGAAIQTACYSYAQMAVARVIAGVGVGLSTVSVPILQSETLPSHNRGALLVVQSALIIIGVAIASWLCFATLYANSSLQWRFPIACQIVFSMLVLCCCPFLPETPRWLAKHGRDDEARHTITRLLNKSEDDPEVKGQLNEILETIAAESGDGEPTWSEVFSNATKSRNLQRVLLGMGPYMMNQWSGINALCYYLAYILETYLNFSSSMSLILASVAFTQYAVFSWPPYFYIDRIGRRWTVIYSSIGCAVCMAVIAGCLLSSSYSTAAVAVAFMFLYLDCFTLGILPVSWSYSAEIQPLRVRNKATAVGVFSHWMSNFVVVMVTPIGLDNISGNYFWIWAIVCASFVPLTYFFGVETSGRTLEQIDSMFFEEPRVCMGLSKNHTKVIRATAADEENRYKAFAKLDEKEAVEKIEEVEAKS
ncbi:MFS-type transporter oryC [Fulvia fulva]|uniref:MFS-type transporter oryC n=1 Tax=Passalora fulva TaxID=5499 RepID=A0A9Q8PHI8_PASFU|nr:MFS-type transporter oryC [Fulvia fulva]KAK4615766.1 MFS-type transporter oryC [Fulvia fulva]KAK4616896.1 MFS-type transporter oryC [Fulvia fulva]UJO22620.1 MFS-type transporter oryC [Fulvia fulva]WPV18771.1 MFS-type transporter oryC [Fulvia fulva]WPV33801.1 MFS-type transporter oryC [Fulvia fulva]